MPEMRAYHVGNLRVLPLSQLELKYTADEWQLYDSAPDRDELATLLNQAINSMVMDHVPLENGMRDNRYSRADVFHLMCNLMTEPRFAAAGAADGTCRRQLTYVLNMTFGREPS